MTVTLERAQEIVDDLRGTCQSVDDVLNDDEDAMDDAIVAAVDSELFECADCGWWCEWSEQAEGTEDEPKCDACVTRED